MRPHPESKKRRNRDRARKWRDRRRHFYFYVPGLSKEWLEPMLWRPLTMEELRYDKMGEGWAAAFDKAMKDFWEGCDRAIMEAVPL